MVSYGDRRQSFVDFLPETGELVSSLGCIAFNVVRDAGLVSKLLLIAEAPKERKKPPRPGTKPQKEDKLKFAAERPSKGWCAQGELCNTWKPNMWILMSPKSSSTTATGACTGATDPTRSPSPLPSCAASTAEICVC